MKFAACFILSAALHVAVLALPVSQNEAERQQAFPVTIVALSEPRRAQAPAPKPPLRNASTTLRRPKAPPTEAIADVKPKAPEEEPVVAPAAEVRPAAKPVQTAWAGEAPKADEKRKAKDPMPLIAEAENPAPGPRAAIDRTLFSTLHPAREIGVSENDEGERRRKEQGSAPLVAARYAYNPPPEYPDSARREGSYGLVLLSVLVDPEGNPEKVEIHQTSGVRSLDEAAMKRVKDWRFHPARQGGRPVQSWVKIPIVFQLSGR